MSPIFAEKKHAEADESQHENILEILKEDNENLQKSQEANGPSETQDV